MSIKQYDRVRNKINKKTGTASSDEKDAKVGVIISVDPNRLDATPRVTEIWDVDKTEIIIKRTLRHGPKDSPGEQNIGNSI
jgi:hypothetical protein